MSEQAPRHRLHSSRREFLGVATMMMPALAFGGGATGAAARPRSANEPQPAASPVGSSPKRTLRKAVMYGMITEGATVAEKFAILKDCGFAGVEMDSPGTISIDEIRKAMDATGIQVHGMVDSAHWKMHLNSPDEAVRAEGVKSLEACVRDAAAVGAVSVLLVPAVVNKNQPYDDAYRLSQEQIRRVLPMANELKVTIAIENVWNGFLLSPLEAARYVDELGGLAAGAGFHFDIGNVINFGWPAQWVKVLGERIVKLHIKDFSRKKRDEQGLWKGFDVELGDGDADWPAVMAALDAIGYPTGPARWATAEVRGGDRARLREIGDRMDRILGLK